MDVSKVIQRGFKKMFKVFQKKSHVAWHSSQLPEQKEGLFILVKPLKTARTPGKNVLSDQQIQLSGKSL